MIPPGSSASLASLIPGGGGSPELTEHTIYISSPEETQSLIMQLDDFLRTGRNAKASSVKVDREIGDGGVYPSPEHGTVGFTFWTQGGAVVGIEDMNGDKVTKNSGPKPEKGADEESQTTVL